MEINSVLGKISTEELGYTLMHEHVVCVDWSARMCFKDRWIERDKAVEIAVGQLKRAMSYGVKTIVDGTAVNIGRDIGLIREVAEKSGMNIIASTGFYYQEDPYLLKKPAEMIIDLLLEECDRGIEGTGILPGIIKTAADKNGVNDYIKKMIKVSSEVHKHTNLPIFAHSSVFMKTGSLQQDEFEKNGVDLSRVIIGHSGDTNDIEYLESILKRGSYIGMDRFGLDYFNPLEERCKTICELAKRGWLDRMVLSHDFSSYLDWGDRSWEKTKNADYFHLDLDYSYVHRKAIPILLEMGLTEDDINVMMVENPRRFFEGK